MINILIYLCKVILKMNTMQSGWLTVQLVCPKYWSAELTDSLL